MQWPWSGSLSDGCRNHFKTFQTCWHNLISGNLFGFHPFSFFAGTWFDQLETRLFRARIQIICRYCSTFSHTKLSSPTVKFPEMHSSLPPRFSSRGGRSGQNAQRGNTQNDNNRPHFKRPTRAWSASELWEKLEECQDLAAIRMIVFDERFRVTIEQLNGERICEFD